MFEPIPVRLTPFRRLHLDPLRPLTPPEKRAVSVHIDTL